MTENEEEVNLIKNVNFKLAFSNLSYQVNSKVPFLKNESKSVLKSISGEFYGNELTAIIGLSGSGKSSLLDCLSGYSQSNITGSITFNDKPISTKIIKNVSSYFMQEQILHVYLTVNELMNFAINMKCRKRLRNDEKQAKIKELLDMLNITDRRNDFILNLSGGERKRFQIAIELVDDPKILFADEPTTNLDIVASNQCIQYLKDIAQQGRMIICTIHQASASMLNMFDHIYALCDGNCIYQGTSQNLVKFLDEVGLPCPSTYNPADYLMEIANNDYGNQVDQLIQKIQNGSNSSFRTEHEIQNPIDIFIKSSNYQDFASSYFLQIHCLICRTFLVAIRDKTEIYFRFGINAIIGIIIGFLFLNIGNNAAYAIYNMRFVMACLCLSIYTSYFASYMIVPSNFPITKREFFNGWYSVKAYYTSVVICDALLILISVTILCTISYVITSQPMEVLRYSVFVGFILATSYVSQALGIMCTSLLRPKIATLVGSLLILIFYTFSLFCLFERDSLPIFHPFFKYSFVNVGVKGAINSIFGLNRTHLECFDIYCHFGDPKKVLRIFECDIDLMGAVYILFVYIVVCHAIGFGLITYRLRNMRK